MFKLTDKVQEMDFDWWSSAGSSAARRPEITIGLQVKIPDEELIVDEYNLETISLYGKNCNGELYTITLSRKTVEKHV